VLHSQALFHISTLLNHDDAAVRARAVGIVHNLSVDAVSIVPILETRCVPQLVELMRDSSTEICRAAAGTIQNLSRDPEARAVIVGAGALEHLSDLLFASDVACQVIVISYCVTSRYCILMDIVPFTADNCGWNYSKYCGFFVGAAERARTATADPDGWHCAERDQV
jgi:hypothetical protein